ncbi:MAG: DNA gyrase subunit A [candidate division WOR-3 bacterium]
MPEQIIPSPITEEMRTSYLDYAMSVIVGRALPDVRDGLKPVQRRILFALRELGLTPDKPFRKSATVVGEVIGKYHPHGESAVYDALVRMAQDFSLRYMLVQGQGNFGSIDGDPPAAYRYTEARLSRVATELLSDIDQETVDFVPNFDGRLQEPVVLPSAFPNLLANGSSGIAVGMATNIPPHNISELVDGLIALIDDPELPDEKLFSLVKGPDFPTGGVILGERGIRDAYTTGRGRIVVRARYKIEEKPKKSPDIVFTEIPYMVSKTVIIEQIAALAREKKIEGIADLRDESDREGMRIVLELKKGFDPEVLVRQLFKHTALQTTFGAILLALDGLQPRLMSLRDMMMKFLAHREEVITRRTRFRLAKAQARVHILEGFLKALDIIDEIIALIRASEEAASARDSLMKDFGFSETQAKAILEMRLSQLTRLEGDKIKSEYDGLLKDIEYYNSLLSDRSLLLSVIKEELSDIKKKFGDERRTTIAPEEGDFEAEELIQEEDVVVLVTKEGYIKRIPLRQYKTYRRRVQGRSALSTYEDDWPIATKIASTHSYTMWIMNNGAAYWMKTYRVPQASFGAKGKPLSLFFKTREEEHVVDALVFDPEADSEKFLVIGTRKGLIKKVKFADVLRGRKGTPVIIFKEGDSVADAVLVSEEDVVMAKEDGRAVRLRLKDIPTRSRRAGAVKGTTGAPVVSLVPVGKKTILFTITEHGCGKRFDPNQEDNGRLQLHPLGRGSRGVVVQRVTEKTGKLVKLLACEDEGQMVVLTEGGVSARIDVSGVPEYRRNSRGVGIMTVTKGDRVVDASLVPRQEE